MREEERYGTRFPPCSIPLLLPLGSPLTGCYFWRLSAATVSIVAVHKSSLLHNVLAMSALTHARGQHPSPPPPQKQVACAAKSSPGKSDAVEPRSATYRSAQSTLAIGGGVEGGMSCQQHQNCSRFRTNTQAEAGAAPIYPNACAIGVHPSAHPSAPCITRVNNRVPTLATLSQYQIDHTCIHFFHAGPR